MDLLAANVSTGALQNLNERHNTPRLHPGTRDQLLGDIRHWLDDVSNPQVVLWLKGSKGLGKSVISDALASLCSQEDRLLGAFFVSGTAPAESGWDDKVKLMPTLAYQIVQNIFFICGYISNAIETNPLIFDLDIATQIDKLIIGPLSIRSDEMYTPTCPMVFILDALDKFPNKASQKQIVEAFCMAMKRAPHQIPFKLFIASHPEQSIQSAFMAPRIAPLMCMISLNDYPAYGDIRTFLIEGFQRFEVHPSFSRYIPFNLADR